LKETDKSKLTGKVAVVIGASKVIGAAVAKSLRTTVVLGASSEPVSIPPSIWRKAKLGEMTPGN
jgi:NAD(P)-dependent dehydrogenase (short-subunit alcohol dehydrogenase family)